jgi:amino acid adenylation domain-containing protein
MTTTLPATAPTAPLHEQDSIAEAFRNRAAGMPDAEALTFDGRTWSYRDIDRWSDAIAADLAGAEGLAEGPVAILTASSIVLVPATLAALKAGAFLLTVDANDPVERIGRILSDSKAAVCLTDRPDIAGAASRIPVVTIRDLPRDAVPAVRRPPHPLALLTFTSGTTGGPKAVAMAQAAMLRWMLNKTAEFTSSAGERISYIALPGYVRSALRIFRTLIHGATLCGFDARAESLSALAEFIRRERITTLTVTPPQLRALGRASLDSLDLSTVTHARFGADNLTLADFDLFRRLFPTQCVLDRGFASSETAGVLSMTLRHDSSVPGPLVPIGRPVDGVEVRLVDEDGNDVPDGEAGELIVASPLLAEGYWNDPDLTAQRFGFDPRSGLRTFRTGDLLKRDSEGLYYFIGRKDSRLKIHGRRIDPLEVETTIMAVAPVAEAAVLGKPNPHGEQRLVAYVVMRPGAQCDPRAIRRAMRATAPAWMIPVRIYALDALPMTRASKIDRAALAARPDSEPIEITGAENELEEQLAGIWARVLGVPVDVDDDYFDDLGGESVSAAHLVTAVEKELGRSIALSQLVELNTVRRMAAHLRTQKPEKPLAILLQRGTDPSLPPFFITAGGGGGVLKYRALAAALGPERSVYGIQPHGFRRGDFPRTWDGIVGAYANAIRTIQPSGPYFLAGYSAGGLTAFGIARLFELSGERVAFLGVLDTVAETVKASFARRAWNRLSLIARDPRHLAGVFLDGKRKLKRIRRHRRQNRARQEMQTRMRAEFLAQDETLPAWLHETKQLIKIARKSNALGPYTGKVTLFRARGGMILAQSHADLGWSRFAPGPVDIVDIEGDHGTILEDYARQTGQALAAAIARAESQVRA